MTVNVYDNNVIIAFTLQKYQESIIIGDAGFSNIKDQFPINRDGLKTGAYDKAFNNSLNYINDKMKAIEESLNNGKHIDLNGLSNHSIFKIDNMNGHYIVNLEKDTIKINYLSRSNSKIKFEMNGEKKVYHASEILAFIDSGYVFETGIAKYRMDTPKKWTFLQKVISGKLNMYTYTGFDRYMSANGDGSMSSGSRTYYTIEYVRLSSESRSKFNMISLGWKKKFKSNCGECSALMKKINEKNSSSMQTSFFVNYYNTYCNIED